MASAGSASAAPSQSFRASLKAISGADIVTVPYKGGAQAMTDMLGGRIQMIFGTLSTLLPLIQQGKIRALAVTSDTRNIQTARRITYRIFRTFGIDGFF